MSQELRCANKLHGVLDEFVLKVKCKSSFCGSKPGVIVMHHFDALTGELLETKRYAELTKEVKEKHGTRRTRSAVRSS